MRLRIQLSVQTDEPVRMTVPGVVVSPMDDGQSPGIVHHLAAHLDAIAKPDGATRRNADVVDDLDSPGATLYVERFMHRVRARPIEEAGWRGDLRGKIYPSRCRAGVRSGQVHAALFTRLSGRGNMRVSVGGNPL